MKEPCVSAGPDGEKTQTLLLCLRVKTREMISDRRKTCQCCKVGHGYLFTHLFTFTHPFYGVGLFVSLEIPTLAHGGRFLILCGFCSETSGGKKPCLQTAGIK